MTSSTLDTATRRADFEAWRARRTATLSEPHGWLSLTGLRWLGEEPQAVEGVPGTWWVAADGVHLRAAAADGLEVLRVSPFRRRSGDGVLSVAALAEPLDRAVRNVRVLARRLAVTTDRHEPVPPTLLDLVDSLAAASLRLGEDLAAVRDPTPAVQALAAVARASVDVPRSTLSSDVVLAQVRSTTVDLLQVAGLDDHEVALLVPRDMPTLPSTGTDASRVDDD